MTMEDKWSIKKVLESQGDVHEKVTNQSFPGEEGFISGFGCVLSRRRPVPEELIRQIRLQLHGIDMLSCIQVLQDDWYYKCSSDIPDSSSTLPSFLQG
jgi:hypothetical protein